MTRFDIRVRRNKFTQSKIDRHKNFQNLIGNYDLSSKKRTKGWILAVGLLIWAIALLLAYFALDSKQKKKLPDSQEAVSYNLKATKNTVYKL